MTTTQYTINDIQAEMRADGSHWWDPDTMRCFGTKVVSPVYQGDGGIYFVTRDKQYDDSFAFTVRSYSPTQKQIGRVGELGEHKTKGTATRAARKLAGSNATEADEQLRPVTVLEQFLADCQKHGASTATITDCKALIGKGKLHTSLMVETCNGREMYDSDDEPLPVLRNCRKAIEKLAKAVGATGVVFGGDPRGCTVKLTFADGYANDMGREGLCVPGA